MSPFPPVGSDLELTLRAREEAEKHFRELASGSHLAELAKSLAPLQGISGRLDEIQGIASRLEELQFLPTRQARLMFEGLGKQAEALTRTFEKQF